MCTALVPRPSRSGDWLPCHAQLSGQPDPEMRPTTFSIILENDNKISSLVPTSLPNTPMFLDGLSHLALVGRLEGDLLGSFCDAWLASDPLKTN